MPLRRSISLYLSSPGASPRRTKEAPARLAGVQEPDTAYDVTDYFVDDVADPWREGDAQERERLHAHAQLRELVTRGDVTQLKSKLQSLGSAAELVVNLTPGGANTLLYIASESGSAPLVSCLIEAGADGRAHPVTRYGPLYAAAYHGHGDVARILLDHFPEAVKQETVEKWLPLHAACMGGHGPMVALLLEYPYPQRVMETYTARCGSRYQFPFDVNACDARGRSALLAAAARPAPPALDALLQFNVPALAGEQQCEEDPPGIEPVTSPHRSGISLGIHAIVTKLTGGNQRPSPSPRRLRPVRLDLAARGDSAVGAAARAGDLAVLQRLLNAGAAADAPAAHPLSSEQADGIRRRSRSADPRGHATDYCDPDVPWTALAAACAGGHSGCAGALLAAGAADPHGAALRHAAARRLTDLMAAILATKAQADPEHKLCRSLVASRVFSRRGADAALTYAALGPSTPVAIHWRDLKCHLASIRMSWVRQAALAVNPRLCGAGAAAGALLAVTRIDVSNNELRLLPHEIFGMMSLRYLNAAGNKLERLPTPSDPGEEEGAGWRARGRSKRNANTNIYTAPLLQEVYLQDNRLPWLPPALFLLPALQSLDVSNNKLRALPPALWAAPALRDLNAALNHLRDLPHGEEDDESPRSPEEGRSPVTSPSATLSMSSRSASSDQEDATSQHPDDVPTLGNRGGNAVWSESRRAHSWRGAVEAPRAAPGRSALTSLNVSHNQFTQLPPALACRAPNLTRLNMAYNSLRSMSYVTSYPTNLRQLDLSHNEITCWPSLPQLESVGSAGESPLSCYCPGGAGSVPPSAAGGVGASRASVRERLLRAACPARSHLRLNALRTLILSNNLLTRIQLTTDDDGTTPELPEQDTPNEEDEEWNSSSSIKARLVFPLLSMLDVSNNLLKAVPPSIHLLTNLSVLNISGNKDVTELPPAMGLLSRLWSLSAGGCALGEPLRSMVRGGHYKSADVVGYLRSVLHAATKYSRMRLMLVGNQGIGKTSLLECLRQESAIQHRRKPTDHWAKRMGNKTSRRNMSTVGVDIGQWTYEKNRSTRGPVTFRTWDFGGQQEYYATHQYFLSRRSLYLVVWKLSDGRKGLAPALSWLRSIQARAPGSPVIMVATHYDQVANSSLSECESPESLQRLIRCSIMAAPDADKLGLPRVMDSIEVSCSTRHNIRLLADIIYSVAFSVKPPGSKEPLLEQRIPASYLALEECVTSDHVTEPVLTHNEYKKMVTNYMQQKNLKGFRDAAELHQATMFLHENGVLLHYDDATLKELYFLRPQWLCDMLAHVVTVREINPFANNGIMKVEDLAHVFKASPSLWASEEASGLGVSLLQKFELALCWDARTLLVPPLLPQSPPTHPQLPVRSRSWSNRRPWSAPAPSVPLTFTDNRHTDSPTLIQESCGVSVAGRDGGGSCARALALTYAPGGLCARLCARLLADPALAAAPRALYCPHELSAEETLRGALEAGWGWKVWRRGAALLCGGLLVLSVTERPPSADPLLAGYTETEKGPYDNIRFRVRQEESWCEMELSSYTCIEILLPAQVCVIKRDDGLPIAGYQSISVDPNPEVLARILAIVSDHIDLLLEDWYPALGTRFVHTSEGKCLITRVIPCPACLKDVQRLDQQDLAQQAMHRLELAADPPPRVSQDSRASDGDSGVGHESNASSRLGSVDGVVDCGPWALAHAWTVEHCILLATTQGTVHCPQHGDMALRQLAPDLLLLDVEESRRARWEHITLRGVLGRGAFGTVFTAVWRAAPGPAKGAAPGAEQAVALKVLQPVPPPPGSDAAALQAYKACVSRWEREPGAAACRAYLSLRAELGVLRRVRHAHVGALLGVCAAPRALLLERARLALDAALRAHAARGRRPGPRTARALLLQVARALEYLHGNRVVYRDLKSENVLVWRLPSPEESAAAEKHSDPIDVHVKLGDYGISRLAPPSGTKGFGGTEGFMAPEIMRYNGEEEYNEKVDCFSFGMLMYEVVTCRQPYEGHEAVKEAVLEGTRPALSPKELQYPVCLVQTMRRCWAVAASARPSAGALVSLLAAPEACPLRDVAAARPARAAAALQIYVPESESVGWEVWYGGGEPERVHTLVATGDQFTQQYSIRITPDKAEPVLVTAICRVGNAVWLGDSVGRISAYCASTCSLLWVEVVCAVVGGACAGAGDGAGGVAALAPLDSLTPARVAVAMACGRLFLVSADRSTEEGTFVLTELGTATELCALATLPVDDGVSVWAGGCALSVFVSLSEGVASAERAALPAAGSVTLLAAGTGLPHVYGYIQPGVCIYQWCVSSKAVVGRLDCSKLVPCSETLDAGAETHHLPDNCRVLSLAVSGRTVAAGTRRGCVVVADGNLRPLAVCRPYHEDVQVIIPLIPRNEEEVPMIATFGSGYRPLLQRYAPAQNNQTQYNGTYCLLWKTLHWLPD